MRTPKIASQLPREVRRFMADHGLIEMPGLLLVGVSGGADSVCLLHVLFQLRDELGLKLHVAHLNHQLRGAESEEDAAYVRRLAQSLEVPVTIEACDVAQYRDETRCSLEEAAREVRYGFFARVAEAVGTSAVVVGHTADDQAETILMHLVRGAGLWGMAGMQPVSTWRTAEGAQLKVIRPLLEVSREETEVYCRAHDLSPRVDSSNVSPDYLRNRIRSELMPLLRTYNPNVRETLTRAARLVSADVERIEEMIQPLWGEVIREEGGGLVLENKAFARLSLSLKGHLLRRALAHFLGSQQNIEAVHIESLLKVMGGPAGKRLSLPGGLVFHGDYSRSLITREAEAPCLLPPMEGEHKLLVPGETVLSGWRVRAEVRDQGMTQSPFCPPFVKGETGGFVPSPATDAFYSPEDFRAVFDFDSVGPHPTVRTRRDGDRFQPLGLSQPKKLQDFMTDAKVPRAWRDRVPLVCAGDRILWVVGWRIDDRAKVTASTRQVLRIEFERL